MTILTLKQILAAPDIERELVSVPEWGGEVWVYGLTGAEVGAYRKSIVTQRGTDTVVDFAFAQVKLVALATRDDNGKRYFVGQDAEKELAKKSEAAIMRIFPVAQKLSRLEDESIQELVEAQKDDPLEGSASDLPPTSEE